MPLEQMGGLRRLAAGLLLAVMLPVGALADAIGTVDTDALVLRKSNSKESKALLRGEYGRLPGEVNEEVRHMAIGDDEVITCRPADLLKPELEGYRKELGDHIRQEEDVLSYALFPQVAMKFFEAREAKERAAAEPEQAAPAAAVPQAEKAEPAAPAAPAVRTLYVEDMGY